MRGALTMFIKFICCDVLARIACDLVAKSPHIVDLEFVPMLKHMEPEKLKQSIKEIIEKSVNGSGRKYDAVILGFGLCGNAVIGLSCPVPMVIPRAHDCCTIFMGSKERFAAAFGDILSARWCSTGYYERGRLLSIGFSDLEQLANYKTSAEYMGYVEQYDEETADYLWETLHPARESDESVYIKIDGFEHSDALERYKADMDGAGVKLKVVDGDISLLRSLVNGEWDEDRFLTVPPGKKIAGVYDMEHIMRAGE
jgi:hypothetical protein